MFRKLLVMTLGMVLLGGLVIGEAVAKKSKLVLRVNTNMGADFDTTIASTGPGGAAFHVSGDICEELDLLDDDCTPIGKFHCWGWLIGPEQAVGPVSQEYHLFDRGKIQVQGFEDDGPRAVVGGTGDFRGVRGQATGFDFSQFGATGEFIATFELERVKSRKSKKSKKD